jgi:hypothetical protein
LGAVSSQDRPIEDFAASTAELGGLTVRNPWRLGIFPSYGMY